MELGQLDMKRQPTMKTHYVKIWEERMGFVMKQKETPGFFWCKYL